jgi:hypothetical protein
MSYFTMVLAGLAQPAEALLSLLGLWTKDQMLTAPEIAARFQTAFPTTEVVVADNVCAPEGVEMFDDQVQMPGLSIRQFGEGTQCTSNFRVMGVAGSGGMIKMAIHPRARILASHTESMVKQLVAKFPPTR